MRRTSVLLGAATLTGVLAVTAGAVVLRTERIDPVADHAALLKNGNLENRGLHYVRGYEQLAELLPNATHGPSGTRLSDSVVVGTITAVAEHTGVIDVPPPGAEGNFRNEPVPFDSPTAHWRNLKLTVTVTDTLAGTPVQTLVLDWGVMGNTARGEDAAAIGRALKDLGTVLVITRAAPSNTLGLTRRRADPTGAVAVVDTDGALSFPFLSLSHSTAIETARIEATYTNSVDTVEEVRQAAAKPAWQAPPPS